MHVRRFCSEVWGRSATQLRPWEMSVPTREQTSSAPDVDAKGSGAQPETRPARPEDEKPAIELFEWRPEPAGDRPPSSSLDNLELDLQRSTELACGLVLYARRATMPRIQSTCSLVSDQILWCHAIVGTFMTTKRLSSNRGCQGPTRSWKPLLLLLRRLRF